MSENKSVFERLDDIEKKGQLTDEKINKLLEIAIDTQSKSSNNKEASYNNQAPQNAMKNFLISAKKEYPYFGDVSDFNKNKTTIKIMWVLVCVAGVLSTLFSSISFCFYSTYTLFENIWLICMFILYSYSVNSKKLMKDTELKNNSCNIFLKDIYGTWRDTFKLKKKYKWFKALAYISIFANIIMIGLEGKSIIILSIIFEFIFFGLSIAFYRIYDDFSLGYSIFVLYKGYDNSKTKEVTILHQLNNNKFISFDMVNEEIKKNIL